MLSKKNKIEVVVCFSLVKVNRRILTNLLPQNALNGYVKFLKSNVTFFNVSNRSKSQYNRPKLNKHFKSAFNNFELKLSNAKGKEALHMKIQQLPFSSS